MKFGELSGLSRSQSWDDTYLRELPSLPASEEDIGGTRGSKADWIWEMVGLCGHVHQYVYVYIHVLH